ncbi:hypothetical protein AB4Y45_40760 [Paraburkholderia sp. EG287A]|uniref:hypothetical protein n=1 Tax=unclassified Paraburkholderia TaxID=2615204 RepID=UPI0034D2D7F9
MNDHVIFYKGYIVDFTPFAAGDATFGPRWSISKDDAVWSGSVPLSTGNLMYHCSKEEAAELGKRHALRMIDCE